MGQLQPSTISSSTASPVSSLIRASAFMGEDGCEHQEFIQPISIIHGSGPDEGSVTIQIGDCIVSFESTEALIAGLQRESTPVAVSEIPYHRAIIVAGIAAGIAGLMAQWVPMLHRGLGVFTTG